MLASLLSLPLAPAPDPYDYRYDGASTAASMGLVLMIMGIYFMIFVVFWLANGFAWAGLFHKAGHPKWAAFVPFYNSWVMVKIAGRPESSFWLQFIPYAGIYWMIVTLNDLAKSFGKDVAYTVGLIFVPVVFAAILSYGDARYLGPAYVSPAQKQYWQNYPRQQYPAQQYPGQGQPQYDQSHYGPQDPQGQYQQYQGQQYQDPQGQQFQGQQPEYPSQQAPQAQPPYGSGPTQQP
ncbi:DUF5684 domain-containing protein [Arthrobacter sp.]|uniref:DUF5684 domain-containing protein n=1 Tax=Arthrobacter sp. TaxID=1667 RepID=UPI0026E0EE5E|nr:DUF5684 domain-containing protein [Arthrobacter sp.]MDO5753938.1 DUF5684 domain-containing protein [Arthrobacter sp.]